MFLTGQRAFEGDTAGAVYLIHPDNNHTFLGAIANDKPSAIFKVNFKQDPAQAGAGGVSGVSTTAAVAGAPGPAAGGSGGGAAVAAGFKLGILVEPSHLVADKLREGEGEKEVKVNDYGKFVTSMCEACYNYLGSFTVTPQNYAQFGCHIEHSRVAHFAFWWSLRCCGY